MEEEMTILSGPNLNGNEWKYVKDCLDSGWVSSVGAYVTKFEDLLIMKCLIMFKWISTRFTIYN